MKERAVTYSVVPRVDPRDISAEMTYYARAQARGEVTLGDMARQYSAAVYGDTCRYAGGACGAGRGGLPRAVATARLSVWVSWVRFRWE